jgi:type IV pilus assembly protein PilB
MVRSDPDALMVGEIRDHETAKIAMEAALTGHFVLSTLHTNNASITASRMIEMGVEPFLIASGIQAIVGQRLARRLCDACKRPANLTPAELTDLGLASNGEPPTFYEPVGCTSCFSTGYSGRVGIYEVMTLNDELRSAIAGKAPASEIQTAASRSGMHTLRDDGLEKAAAGVTSIAEVLRVVGESA